MRLFLLIMATILVVECLLLAPSLAKFRRDWFRERIEAAYLVSLALESPSGGMITPEDTENIFETANIRGVTIEREFIRLLIMPPSADLNKMPVRHFVDLDDPMSTSFIAAPVATLFAPEDDLIRVKGKARYADDIVDILVAKQDLRRDLVVYARNIVGLSLLISFLTGSFVYWRLNRLIVRPIRRMIDNMTAFEKMPEASDNVLKPSLRGDEIGAAERGLANLERRVQELLAERERLAAVGAGVSKISHDLRNVLASAQLMSDRLAKSDDPRVKKLSPRLISSLDRAIALSRDTLNYARMGPGALRKETVRLRKIVDDVFDDAASMHVAFESDVPEDLTLTADGPQLYRAIFNLARNAVDALTPEVLIGDTGDAPPAEPQGRVTISAYAAGPLLRIRIADNGPGIPDAAREHLFEPFKGSLKPGGTGLGVAIAHEIVKAHGGRLSLAKSDETGATFEIELPR